MSLATFQSGLYRNNTNTPWRADIEARFVELWSNGHTASNIAVFLGSEFGIKLSRNACIGKAYRLALPRRKKQPCCTDPVKLSVRKMQRREYLRKWRADHRPQINAYDRGRYATRRLAPEIEDYAIPTPQRKTLMELERCDCRWPVGDPKMEPFFFCGAIAEKDKPYCISHCARAYVEIRPR